MSLDPRIFLLIKKKWHTSNWNFWSCQHVTEEKPAYFKFDRWSDIAECLGWASLYDTQLLELSQHHYLKRSSNENLQSRHKSNRTNCKVHGSAQITKNDGFMYWTYTNKTMKDGRHREVQQLPRMYLDWVWMLVEILTTWGDQCLNEKLQSWYQLQHISMQIGLELVRSVHV